MMREILGAWRKRCIFLGQEAVVTGDKETILSAEKVILPGVGAFGDAMNTIRERRMERA